MALQSTSLSNSVMNFESLSNHSSVMRPGVSSVSRYGEIRNAGRKTLESGYSQTTGRGAVWPDKRIFLQAGKWMAQLPGRDDSSVLEWPAGVDLQVKGTALVSILDALWIMGLDNRQRDGKESCDDVIVSYLNSLWE